MTPASPLPGALASGRDADEAAGVRWLEPERLLAEIDEHPGRFTPWFRLILEKMPQLVSGPR